MRNIMYTAIAGFAALATISGSASAAETTCGVYHYWDASTQTCADARYEPSASVAKWSDRAVQNNSERAVRVHNRFGNYQRFDGIYE